MSDDSAEGSIAESIPANELSTDKSGKDEKDEEIFSGQLDDPLQQFMQRQNIMENLFDKFMQRQQSTEDSFNRFLDEQIRRNDSFENKLDELKSHLLEPKTVEGKENPGGTVNPMGSDRVIPDTTLGGTWLGVMNPSNTSLGHELVTSKAAPFKSMLRQTSVAPDDYRVKSSPGNLSSDLNPSPGSVFIGSIPQQCVQSLEGATHASIPTIKVCRLAVLFGSPIPPLRRANWRNSKSLLKLGLRSSPSVHSMTL